jgi:cardiolipin synthase (CMP-forming)
LYLPNIITVGRIFTVPVMIWLIVTGNLLGAFLLFVVAGLSDALDGYLARRFNWQTELGAYLDPIADKALLTTVYAVLTFHGYTPIWLGIAVVTRDVLIVGAVVLAWLLERPINVRPLLIGKINTVLQVVVAGMVLAEYGLTLGWMRFITPFLWLTGLMTALSALFYLVGWLRHMASYDAIERRLNKSGPGAGMLH